ncbi:MAG TPA: hypothetical protein VN158_03315, partial [Caulobacter sp.]|nr:hypothetical protein [Caulobacter sp.]
MLMKSLPVRLCAFGVVRRAVGANYCKLTRCNQPKKSQTKGHRFRGRTGITRPVASLRHLYGKLVCRDGCKSRQDSGLTGRGWFCKFLQRNAKGGPVLEVAATGGSMSALTPWRRTLLAMTALGALATAA